MKRSRLRTALVVLGGCVLMIVVGGWLGTVLGKYRVDGRRKESMQNVQTHLDSALEGIKVGQEFPDIPIWSPDGLSAYHIRDLLPEGGILFFFAPECDACQGAVESLHTALDRLGDNAKPSLAITGSHPEPLIKAMDRQGIQLPLYLDLQESLRKIHQLDAARVYFRLDDSGILRALGPLDTEVPQFITLLQENSR